jgi:hypothetical protein
MKRAASPVAVAGLLMALSSSGALAAGFACPQMGQIDSPATLAKIQPLLPLDVDLKAPQQLASAVFILRGQGMPAATIVNNLVAAYCPTVATNSSLSDTEKTQRVQRFSVTASKLAYSS